MKTHPANTRQPAAAGAHSQASDSAAPAPINLDDLFGSLPECVAGLRVRRFVQWDLMILRAIDSPFADIFAAKSARKLQVKSYAELSNDPDCFNLMYLLTRPCKECAELIRAQGPDVFKARAFEEIALTLSPGEVGLLLALTIRSFIAAMTMPAAKKG